MFLYLSKLLPIFLYPFGLSILASLLGLVLQRHRRLSRTLSLVACGLLVSFSVSPASTALLGSLERQYPEVGIGASPDSQAIVVLGGMVKSPSQSHRNSGFTDASDRLMHAFRLFRARKAPFILISGGNIQILGGRDRIPEAQAASQLLQEWGVPPEAILIEDSSRNTHENAVNSLLLLTSRGLRNDILLVTSASHMPRAVGVFRKAGFQVTATPTDFKTGNGVSRTSSFAGCRT